MFKKILIANRGEIALRIARTCQEVGIKTVAVYSDLDREAPYVHFADEAYPLQGVTSLETYLRSDKILDICQKSGAEAIHPGYGFLAENAGFAREVEKAGIVFIGPPARAIERMGNKTAARKLMEKAGVPVVPGTQSPLKSISDARNAAKQIGFPVLIKAAAGGGGKGMRVVETASEFESAVSAAKSEAKSAFGDPSVYIEKFLEEPRHIEFQILADSSGRIIHLGERECSIQRRHQKIIEESPSAILDADLRNKMGEAAVKAARACAYLNAGTVEFLIDKHRNYYFLEMNTRLQVEHPVTEMVTGLDLVIEQLLIASGLEMSLQKSIQSFWGHAIECRIYAEDPENNFAPSPGTIQHIAAPGGPGIREDSGVIAGSKISLYYDPMISKLCSWAPTRTHAIRRMVRALREYELQGIHSTIPLLIKILEHPRFIEGDINTAFINQEREVLSTPGGKVKLAALAAALLQQQEKNKKIIPSPQNGQSLWKSTRRRSLLERK